MQAGHDSSCRCPKAGLDKLQGGDWLRLLPHGKRGLPLAVLDPGTMHVLVSAVLARWEMGIEVVKIATHKREKVSRGSEPGQLRIQAGQRTIPIGSPCATMRHHGLYLARTPE